MSKGNGDGNIFGGKNPHGLYVPMTEESRRSSVDCRGGPHPDRSRPARPEALPRSGPAAAGPFRLSQQPGSPDPAAVLDLELQGPTQTIVKERMPLPGVQVCRASN